MAEVLEAPVEIEREVEKRWMVMYHPTGVDKSIKSGRHAECMSLEEAIEQKTKCEGWFNRELVQLAEGRAEWRDKKNVRVQIDYWENGVPIRKDVEKELDQKKP